MTQHREPGRANDEAGREANDIGDEFVRMVTRRLVEGTSPGVLAAGLAVGLAHIGQEGPEGRELIDAMLACLGVGDPNA